MFKVGDKVRRINSFNDGFKMNNIGTITKIQDNGKHADVFVNGKISCNNFFDNLELVSESSELEELVKKANEGFKAIREMRDKHHNNVELLRSSKDIYYRDISGYVIDMSFDFTPNIRIKSKVHKFKVSCWEAEINGENVKIGCVSFNKSILIRDFKNLIRYYKSQSGMFSATKNGIIYYEHHITWNEAEKLLKELEK